MRNKQTIYAILVCVVLLATVGCHSGSESVKTADSASVGSAGTASEKPAAVPANSYEKDGISFVLRPNWKVTEDQNMGGGVRYLSIENDKNAIVALTFIPSGTKPDLKKYASEFISSMRSGLAGGTLTENGESEVSRNAANVEKKGLVLKYTVTISGESIPNTAELFLISGRKYDCVATYSVPDDEKSATDAEFETILYTTTAK